MKKTELNASAGVCMHLTPAHTHSLIAIYIDKPNHENPEFCESCGQFMASLLPAEMLICGLYCPFPNEQPVLDELGRRNRISRFENRNLAFPLINIPEEVKLFSSGEFLYFGVAFYVIAGDCRFSALQLPPRFRFWHDPWKGFNECDNYPLRAVIHPDHPVCEITIRHDLTDEKRIRDCFNKAFL